MPSSVRYDGGAWPVSTGGSRRGISAVFVPPPVMQPKLGVAASSGMCGSPWRLVLASRCVAYTDMRQAECWARVSGNVCLEVSCVWTSTGGIAAACACNCMRAPGEHVEVVGRSYMLVSVGFTRACAWEHCTPSIPRSGRQCSLHRVVGSPLASPGRAIQNTYIEGPGATA